MCNIKTPWRPVAKTPWRQFQHDAYAKYGVMRGCVAFSPMPRANQTCTKLQENGPGVSTPRRHGVRSPQRLDSMASGTRRLDAVASVIRRHGVTVLDSMASDERKYAVTANVIGRATRGKTGSMSMLPRMSRGGTCKRKGRHDRRVSSRSGRRDSSSQMRAAMSLRPVLLFDVIAPGRSRNHLVQGAHRPAHRSR